MMSASSLSTSRSTSKRDRSRSTPASEIDSRTRTLTSGHGLVLVRLERRRHRDATLDVRAEIGEHDLDGGERRRDVENVEPADVSEPEDLSLPAALAGRHRHPEAVSD